MVSYESSTLFSSVLFLSLFNAIAWKQMYYAPEGYFICHTDYIIMYMYVLYCVYKCTTAIYLLQSLIHLFECLFIRETSKMCDIDCSPLTRH